LVWEASHEMDYYRNCNGFIRKFRRGNCGCPDARSIRRDGRAKVGAVRNRKIRSRLGCQSAPAENVGRLVLIEEDDVVAKAIEGGGHFWGLFANGGATYETAVHNLGGRKFNVHPDNQITCNDRSHVDLVGLADCLGGEVGNFQGLGGYAECGGEATATLSAKAGIQGWFVGVDASGSWQKKITYKVTVRIPSEGDAPGTRAEK
jgi:hypothetical protein